MEQDTDDYPKLARAACLIILVFILTGIFTSAFMLGATLWSLLN